MAKKEDTKATDEQVLTVHQICNEMQVNGILRNYLIDEYKDKILSKDKWIKLLQNKGIDF